jgi:hypothetical protein
MKDIPETWTPKEAYDYAAGWHGATFTPSEPQGQHPETFDWTYHPGFDLSLVGAEQNSCEWISFFEEEQDGRATCGQPGYYDDLLEGPIREPIVVVMIDGRAWIWDGWHRTAASHVLGRTTIPAICGVPRV